MLGKSSSSCGSSLLCSCSGSSILGRNEVFLSATLGGFSVPLASALAPARRWRVLPLTCVLCLRRCLLLGSLRLCAGIRDGAFAARALPLCGVAVTFFVPQGDFLRGASARSLPTGPQRPHRSRGNVLTWGRCQRARTRLTRFMHPHHGEPNRAFSAALRQTL